MALAAVLAARTPAGSRFCCAVNACFRQDGLARMHSAGGQPQQQLEQETTQDSSGSASTSTSSNPSSSAGSVNKDGFEQVYQGFFARPHKRLKYASLLNTFASFAAAPLIISYSTASPIARVAVTTSVIAFALITTGGLHWFTSPYVHQLLYNKESDVLRAQTLSLLGGTKWRQFPMSAVSEPTGYHPLASFKADGRTYYIDRANFPDAQLLQRLMPWAPAQQEEDKPLSAGEDNSPPSNN